MHFIIRLFLRKNLFYASSQGFSKIYNGETLLSCVIRWYVDWISLALARWPSLLYYSQQFPAFLSFSNLTQFVKITQRTTYRKYFREAKFLTHCLGVELFATFRISKLITMASYMTGRVWTNLLTCLGVFRRVWMCLNKIGRASSKFSHTRRKQQTQQCWPCISLFLLQPCSR